jgi:DNA-directed RNA polymerase
MTDIRHQIELDVGAALECAEGATWMTNELVARTLETAVTGKEAATTLHHAYSAQVHVARVFQWAKEWGHSQELALSMSPPAILDDCLTWMRRARDHAEKLCRCFPTSEEAVGKAARIAEWAERWPHDYAESKSRAEKSLEKINSAIYTIERQQQIINLGSSGKT